MNTKFVLLGVAMTAVLGLTGCGAEKALLTSSNVSTEAIGSVTEIKVDES